MIESKDIVFNESAQNFDLDRLTPEQRRTYEAAQASANKEFAPDAQSMLIMGYNGVKAGYKIEIWFGKNRTPQGPNVCMIKIWESGKRLDGEADDQMYWCRDVEQNSNLGCGKPIPSACIQGGVALCPHCQMAIRADRLTGEQIHKMSTNRLAMKVEQLFHDLKDNADIYCKYSPGDIRYDMVLKERGFEKARQLRGLFIYPLKNILKDTSAGATLHSRFRAFLSA